MFSGSFYTADKNFTQSPVATVATNSKSESHHFFFIKSLCSLCLALFRKNLISYFSPVNKNKIQKTWMQKTWKQKLFLSFSSTSSSMFGQSSWKDTLRFEIQNWGKCMQMFFFLSRNVCKCFFYVFHLPAIKSTKY